MNMINEKRPLSAGRLGNKDVQGASFKESGEL